MACLHAEEFRLANICGLHIIVHPDHLEDLIGHYERAGRSTELIQLMEQGLGLDHAHSGIFTELGVLYSRYLPDKLMEHIKIFWSRMNVTKLLRACERSLLWTEAVYLYKEDGQADAAIRVMIDHSVAFQHEVFLDCVQKVRNPEVQYKAIGFYISHHPMQLVRLLQVLTPHLDHGRVVHLLRKSDALLLAWDYLRSVQKENLSTVNEAVNDVCLDTEDYRTLRTSVDDFDNFDPLVLAQRLERHELLEFRRLAAYLYKKNKRYGQSVQLSKSDGLYKDAMDTVAESGDADLAEDLLRYFVTTVQDKACFSATLYTCYDLIKPDIVVELAWRHGYTDYSMPFIIQYLRHLHDKVHVLETRTAPKEEVAQPAADAGLGFGMGMMNPNMLMIENTAAGYGYGAPAYGAAGGIPDPYQQQPAYGGYGMGGPAAGGAGGGYGGGYGAGGYGGGY